MFEGMSEYLTGLCHINSYKYNSELLATHSTNPYRTPEKEVDAVADEESIVTSSSHQTVPRVELVSLFTDLSGLVREKSQFTQYINYCYRLCKNTKPAVVEILPANEKQEDL